MRLKDLIEELHRMAPPAFAEPWDNVGLIAGDPASDVNRVLLTIDYTAAVSAEALPGDLVVAYHPPLFKPASKLVADGPHGLVFDAIRRGIAIYSPHTALDVADGGTNDVLADFLDLLNRKPLKLMESRAAQFKLVTFVPESAVETVADAMTSAGAGKIGDYTECTFRSKGVGTFRGGAGSNPTIGRAGEMETVDEIRLESVVSAGNLPNVIAAITAAHPYETPAFDLIPLAAVPSTLGIGRVGLLPEPAMASAVIDRLKRAIGASTVTVAGEDRMIKSVGICAGSGGDFVDHAIAAGTDLYVTGEMRHHDALKANAAGMVVVCTLHSCSERPVLHRIKARLDQFLRTVPHALPVVVSRTDLDPFRFA